LKQAAGATLRVARNVLARAQRLDVRHRRDNSVAVRKRPKSRARDEDDEGLFVYGAAWA
jgi:hypothetical protein